MFITHDTATSIATADGEIQPIPVAEVPLTALVGQREAATHHIFEVPHELGEVLVKLTHLGWRHAPAAEVVPVEDDSEARAREADELAKAEKAATDAAAAAEADAKKRAADKAAADKAEADTAEKAAADAKAADEKAAADAAAKAKADEDAKTTSKPTPLDVPGK